jgi:hypothetical protein
VDPGPNAPVPTLDTLADADGAASAPERITAAAADKQYRLIVDPSPWMNFATANPRGSTARIIP